MSAAEQPVRPPATLDADAVAELLGSLCGAVDRGRVTDASACLHGLLDPDVRLDRDAIAWAVEWLRRVEGVGSGR